jgi:hypothetical protein
MGKIAGYVIDNNVTLGDMLIGTDIDNLNETKNYTVWGLLNLISTQLLSVYVPYTGATGNVDLGGNDLSVNEITVANGITCLAGNILGYGQIESVGTLIGQGLITGQFVSATNGMDVGVGPLFANATAGLSGQILESQGPGVSPQWVDHNSILPYAYFYNSTSQAGTVLDAILVEFPQIGISNPYITINDDGLGNFNQITFVTSGTFKIDVSLQIIKAVGTAQYCLAWIRKNGVDVGSSAVYWAFHAGADLSNRTASWVIDGVSTDYVEVIFFTSDSIGLNFAAAYSGINVGVPAVPSSSVIVTKIA